MFLIFNYFLLLVIFTNLFLLKSFAELAPCLVGQCPEMYGPCQNNYCIGKLEPGETVPLLSSGEKPPPPSSSCKDIGKGCKLIKRLFVNNGASCSSSVSLVCASTCKVCKTK
ncbi:hypothetical protein ACQ4LE_004619 [Meloidogyne hapla]